MSDTKKRTRFCVSLDGGHRSTPSFVGGLRGESALLDRRIGPAHGAPTDAVRGDGTLANRRLLFESLSPAYPLFQAREAHNSGYRLDRTQSMHPVGNEGAQTPGARRRENDSTVHELPRGVARGVRSEGKGRRNRDRFRVHTGRDDAGASPGRLRLEGARVQAARSRRRDGAACDRR